MADFGYDVADYCGIDPTFGTMQDFDCLLFECHERGLKVILDFVPNHTSDQHPWFLESKSSRESPKRDWYIWRDKPNNWLSQFGGSAWEFDAMSGQYYCHSFLKEQPDLNWRNPAVKDAMFDVLRFWLDRGVDGFRVDVMWLMIKDDQFRDNPPNPGYVPGNPSSQRLLSVFNSDRPEVHAVVAEMRAVLDEYEDRVLIGEIYLPVKLLMTYYGTNLQGASLPFNFLLLQCAWSADSVRTTISEYMAALPSGAWANWVLGNHDNARIATKVGIRQASVAAMLLLTLPGTLTMYYGEEIGMTNVAIPPENVKDPAEKNQPGIGMGRDPERTPMQWDSSPCAGFTTATPWLPLASDFDKNNVATLLNDNASLLHLYRSLIALRRTHSALISGKVSGLSAESNLLCYERTDTEERLLILLNLGFDPIEAKLQRGTVLSSTGFDRNEKRVEDVVTIRGAEGLIILLDDTLSAESQK
jgi:alpha-glucosidase